LTTVNVPWFRVFVIVQTTLWFESTFTPDSEFPLPDCGLVPPVQETDDVYSPNVVNDVPSASSPTE
jgi:hypothetical protein